MASVSHQRPRKLFQSVATWYIRAPITPAGSTQVAITPMSFGPPPAARHRLSVSQTATNMPKAMNMP